MVCRVLVCLSSLLLHAPLGTLGTAGLIDVVGDQSLYELEKESRDEQSFFSISNSGAKWTCLRKMLTLAQDSIYVKMTYLAGRTPISDVREL